MDKNHILEEKEKWKNKDFLDQVTKNFNSYCHALDNILYERYINTSPYNQEFYNEYIDMLRFKNVVNENKELVKEDYVEISDKAGINGGYGDYKVFISPLGAELLYNSYILFSEGHLEGIRNYDYSLGLNDLQDLSELELLYWCYVHNVTYEEFCKTTLLHENIHRWTLSICLTDDSMNEVITEGLVESEARDVALSNGIEYMPIFRRKEITVTNAMAKIMPISFVRQQLFEGNTEKIILMFLKLVTNREDYTDYYLELSDIFDQELFMKKEYAKQKTYNNNWTSFHEIFKALELFDQNSLLNNIDSYIETIKNTQK